MSEIELKNQEMSHANKDLGNSTLCSKTIGKNNLEFTLKFELEKKFQDFGLTEHESKIYLFLGKNGPKKAIEISRSENIPRTEIYHLLSILKNKGIVTPSSQIRTQKFSAITINNMIELLIENQKKKIAELKLLKEEMVYMLNYFQESMQYKKLGIRNFKSIN